MKSSKQFTPRKANLPPTCNTGVGREGVEPSWLRGAACPALDHTSEKVISTGFDWLTVTSQSVEGKRALVALGTEMLMSEIDSGNEKHSLRFSGYEGWIAGGVQVAQRYDSVCLRVTSGLAADSWFWIKRAAENCTRCDLQVTVYLGHDPLDYVLDHEREAYESVAHWRRKPEISLRRKNDGAHTLYLGKRVSNNFGRVYDKGRESKLPELMNCIRYERQVNGALAWRVLTAVAEDRSPRSRIHTEVSRYFSRFNIKVPGQSADTKLTVLRRPESDAARKLTWLRAQVGPSVKFLLDHYSRDVIMEALGLPLGDDDVVHGPTLSSNDNHSPEDI